MSPTCLLMSPRFSHKLFFSPSVNAHLMLPLISVFFYSERTPRATPPLLMQYSSHNKNLSFGRLRWLRGATDTYALERLAGSLPETSGAGPAHRDVTLEQCLEAFGQKETLDPEDAWFCPKCKDLVQVSGAAPRPRGADSVVGPSITWPCSWHSYPSPRVNILRRKHGLRMGLCLGNAMAVQGRLKCCVQADKKMDLWTLPDVLVVHLKRFSYTTYSRDKLDTPVRFPIEGLDLSRHVLNPEGKGMIYDLYAVR